MNTPRRTWLLPALVAAVLFVPSLFNDFAYDDVGIISANQTLHDLANFRLLLSSPYWGTGRGRELGLWRPLTIGYFALTWFVSGGSAWLFHLGNVLLHAAVSALVALLGASLFSAPAGLIAGLLFAVHPVHVEAVANIVGAGELLAALPMLVVLLLVCARRWRAPLPRGRVLLAALLFGVAFLAKESAAMLPALIVLVDASRARLRVRELGAYLRLRAALFASLAVVGGGVLLLRWRVLGSLAKAYPPLGADLLADIPRIWTIAPVWAEYVRLVLFPLRLSPDYSPDVIPVRTMWSVPGVVGAGLALALLVLAFLLLRSVRDGSVPDGGAVEDHDDAPRALALGLLWFIVAILPTSNVLVLSGVLLAERSLYVPTAGLAIAAGALLVSWRGVSWRFRRLLVGLALVLFSVQSVAYTRVWRTTGTVMRYLMQNVSDAGRGHWVMGDLLLNRGDTETAVREFRRALTLLDGGKRFLASVGGRLFEVGEYEKARIILERVVEDYPDEAPSMRMLAIIGAQQGDLPAAAHWAREVIRAGDGDLRIRDFLSTVLGEMGRWDDAVTEREELMKVGGDEEPQLWYLLARAYAEAGRRDDALRALDAIQTPDSVPGAPELRTELEGGNPLSQSP